MQAEDFDSGTLMKTPRKTASRGHTVQGMGEANYMLNLTEDISNPSIRLRYTKGQSAGNVVIYVDGRRQPTIKMDDEGSLGEYEMTKEMRLLHGLPAGSHTVTLEVHANPGEMELDYFVIHNTVEHSNR